MKCQSNSIYTIAHLKTIITILKDNEIYRINDCIRSKITHIINKEISTNKIYENSLLRKYLDIYKKTEFCEQHDNDHNQEYAKEYKRNLLYECLMKYIENKKPKLYDHDDKVLVHLRLGDLCNKFKTDMHIILNDIEEYVKVNSEIKEIVLVTAFHYGQCEKQGGFYKPGNYSYSNLKNQKNYELLESLIAKLPLPVTIESTTDIDRDFCILSTAKHLLVTFGGFSRLVKIMNKKYYDKH